MTRRAHDLAWPDLVWSHFSRPRFGGFDERIAAAQRAGFAGIGLYLFEYERMKHEEGRDAAWVAARLAEHDLCLAELEALKDWWRTDDTQMKADSDRALDLACELADATGARYLQVIGPYECSFDEVVDRFGALCDRMAAYGVLVGIEWLPYTNIANAHDTQQIVEACGRANAGYCADIWHHERGANDLAMVRALPAERVFAVQMNDGPKVPVLANYKDDCMATRVAPGDGEFDCVGFIRTLQQMGVTAPISLEIASTEMWKLPADECARQAVDGMRAVLAAAAE